MHECRDAIGVGGSIRIESLNRKISSKFCRRHPEARPGEFVELVIQDDGEGMNEQTLAHLFEPFFTTKEPGKGTGLGLAIVYNILKHYQGWITVSSRSGKGSTFHVWLPRCVYSHCDVRPAPARKGPVSARQISL